MITTEQLEAYRALANKKGHDGLDASKALLALPVLLAEVDRLWRSVVELVCFAEEMAGELSSTAENIVSKLKARAGL